MFAKFLSLNESGTIRLVRWWLEHLSSLTRWTERVLGDVRHKMMFGLCLFPQGLLSLRKLRFVDRNR